MPRDRDRFGNGFPISPQKPGSTVPGPSGSPDLAARLQEIAGGDLTQLSFDEAQLGAWNEAFTNATHQRFEHRALVGIALLRLRPVHGGIGAFHEQVAERLGRTSRWVRDTARVAGLIEEAMDEGVSIPLEIREISWVSVPGALDNVRQGHPLDWKPDKLERAPTMEELEAAVDKALSKLEEALQAFPDPERWAAKRQEVVERIQALEEPAVEAEEPEPPTPRPAPPRPAPPAPRPAPPAPRPEPRERDPRQPRGRGGGPGRRRR